ncbi:MAG: hypothetical protein ACOYB2_10490 [Limnohabitans sp.]
MASRNAVSDRFVQVARTPQFFERHPEADVAELVEFPVGHDLERAVEPMLDRMPASSAIRAFATEMGVDLRDVIDTMLDGEPLGQVQVKRFLTNTGLRPLFSPVVEDGLRLGLNRIAARWQNLVAKTVQVDGMTYEYYEFSNGVAGSNPGQPTQADFGLRRVGQGAPIPVARVTVSGKSYTLFKIGRGIEWTDESKNAPIDLAAMWFQQVGLQIGWDYHDELVDRLLNGYFTDNSDDAPVLSSQDVGVITDADMWTAVGTLELQYGYIANVGLASLTRKVQVQTMENGAGQRLFPNGLTAAGLPDIQIAATVPDDKIVYLDSGFAILRLVNREFGTEFDRNPRTQVEGSYGTAIELIVPLFPNSRIILDC